VSSERGAPEMVHYSSGISKLEKINEKIGPGFETLEK